MISAERLRINPGDQKPSRVEVVKKENGKNTRDEVVATFQSAISRMKQDEPNLSLSEKLHMDRAQEGALSTFAHPVRPREWKVNIATDPITGKKFRTHERVSVEGVISYLYKRANDPNDPDAGSCRQEFEVIKKHSKPYERGRRKATEQKSARYLQQSDVVRADPERGTHTPEDDVIAETELKMRWELILPQKTRTESVPRTRRAPTSRTISRHGYENREPRNNRFTPAQSSSRPDRPTTGRQERPRSTRTGNKILRRRHQESQPSTISDARGVENNNQGQNARIQTDITEDLQFSDKTGLGRIRRLIKRAADNQRINDERAQSLRDSRAGVNNKRRLKWVAAGVATLNLAAAGAGNGENFTKTDKPDSSRARIQRVITNNADINRQTETFYSKDNIRVRLSPSITRPETTLAPSDASSKESVHKHDSTPAQATIVTTHRHDRPVDNNKLDPKPVEAKATPTTVATVPLSSPNNENNREKVKKNAVINEEKRDNMAISRQVLDFIKQHESWSATVYKDPVGLPTIGYGHLIKDGENFNNPLTQQEGEDLLRKDIEAAQNAIRELIYVPINQNEFDALTSFVFNLGRDAFEKSTLRREINAGNIRVAPGEIVRWNKAYDKNLDTYIVLPGLVNRRADEVMLFITPSDKVIQPVTEAPKIDESVKIIDGIEVKAITLEGHMLRVDVADAFKKAQELAGGRIVVNSAGRSYEKQKALFDCWQAGDKSCNPADNPDLKRSTHMDFAAIDVENWEDPKIMDALLKAGFYRPYPDPSQREMHHFELAK